MDCSIRCMSGSLPLRGLRNFSAVPSHADQKRRKQPAGDLDSFLNRPPPSESSPKFGKDPTRHRQATSHIPPAATAHSRPAEKQRRSYDPRSRRGTQKENFCTVPEKCDRSFEQKRRHSRAGRGENERLNKSCINCAVRKPEARRTGSRPADENVLAKSRDTSLPKYTNNFVDPSVMYCRDDVLFLQKDINIAVPACNVPDFNRTAAFKPSLCPQPREAAVGGIELELRQHGLTRTRLAELFGDIIAASPQYGRALGIVKQLYEARISQLTDRVARRDAKLKEFKEALARGLQEREETDRKRRVLEDDAKKQLVYIETQKSIIKDLRARLENEAPETRDYLEKVLVPPLDLSKLRPQPPQSRTHVKSEDHVEAAKKSCNDCDRSFAVPKGQERGWHCEVRKGRTDKYRDEFDALIGEF